MEGGRQMYCKDCADQAVKANVSAAKRIYNAENYDHLDAIARERKEGIKICQVCGKPVMEKSTTVTCSPECAAIQRSRWQRDADLKRGKRKT